MKKIKTKKLEYIFRKKIWEREQKKAGVSASIIRLSKTSWVEECDGDKIKFKKNAHIAKHFVRKSDIHPYIIFKEWCQKVED